MWIWYICLPIPVSYSSQYEVPLGSLFLDQYHTNDLFVLIRVRDATTTAAAAVADI